MEDEPGFLENSVCKDCIYMVSRLLIPNELDMLDLDPDYVQETKELGDSIMIEQNTCAILNMDIMYEVVRCNKYEEARSRPSIFSGPNPLFG